MKVRSQLPTLLALLVAMLAVIFLPASGLSAPHGVEWQPVFVDKLGAFTYSGSSIAINPNNQPTIAYYINNALRFATIDGSTIYTSTIDTAAGQDGYFRAPVLVYNMSSEPNVIYYKSDSAGKGLYWSYRDGAAWTSTPIEINFTFGGYNDLAIDHLNRVHVVYSIQNASETKYAYREGGQWHIETISGATRPDLAVDSTGNPHIVYIGTNYQLYHTTKTTSGWNTTELTSPLSGNQISYADIQIDSQDNKHIVFQSGPFRYLFWDTAKHYEDVDTFQTSIGAYYISLQLDSQDQPHLAVWGTASDSFYLYKEGGVWQREVIDPRSTGFDSLALDHNDKPHVTYWKTGPDGYGTGYATRELNLPLKLYLPLTLRK